MIHTDILATGILGTDECPATRLRTAIMDATDPQAQDAALDAYEAYLRAEMAIVDAALTPAATAASIITILDARAKAIANSTLEPRRVA